MTGSPVIIALLSMVGDDGQPDQDRPMTGIGLTERLAEPRPPKPFSPRTRRALNRLAEGLGRTPTYRPVELMVDEDGPADEWCVVRHDDLRFILANCLHPDIYKREAE